MTEREWRQLLVDTSEKYYGVREYSEGHRKILVLYNSQKELPRGVKMVESYDWCAAFDTAMSVECGLTDIIPGECSCNRQIALWKKMGRWMEKDSFVPDMGDYIYYDWQDSGRGENTSEADHVGIIVSVSGDTIKVIEGNKGNKVDYRYLKVNGRYIRGYGLPDYASKATETSNDKKSVDEIAKEVLDGKWGNGDARKTALTKAGYDYDSVQAKVNALSKKAKPASGGSDNAAKKETRKEKYTRGLQVSLNVSYKAGLVEDASAGPLTRGQIDKHYLYYKIPTIKNAHVSWIQDALKELGYDIEVDGSYGPATRAIVMQFQRDHGLIVDGYAGVKTHMMILSLL